MMARAFICGFHVVTGRLRAAPASVSEIYLDAARDDARSKALVKLAAEKGVRVMQIEASRLDGFAKGARHQGVVASVESIATATKSLDDLLDGVPGPPLLLVLDGVTDPHNLGACLRVADGAGVDAVIAPKDRACGINATVSKVASGAAEVIPYFMVTNLARTLEELKERNIWIIGTMDDAPKSLYEAEFPAASAWVFGAEGEGMRRLTREKCDLRVKIPMQGSVESLNVSVSVGVCLFEARRRRGPG
jgi:23S rRNA (guanosine2251-2'-O)-methyltransferase